MLKTVFLTISLKTEIASSLCYIIEIALINVKIRLSAVVLIFSSNNINIYKYKP